ncbi:hypothetical protein GBAR_LOCUS16930 [Geodia barretti]|uniref:Uncharacterized protein n=1 Tax=Geodia barretti TaxID=519541 RepID=A0AA35WX43_GEOBA|nr:hypothetical protein GBAR_LOCUS16930 [Geodia barretti]
MGLLFGQLISRLKLATSPSEREGRLLNLAFTPFMELCILHAIFLVLSSRDPVCICGVTTCFHMPTAGYHTDALEVYF